MLSQLPLQVICRVLDNLVQRRFACLIAGYVAVGGLNHDANLEFGWLQGEV